MDRFPPPATTYVAPGRLHASSLISVAMALLEFSMTPLGVGESVSQYVARCVQVVEQSGLDFELHAMGTIVEGEIEELLAVLQQCFATLAPDCQRISCVAKFDYRQGASGRIKAKVASVEQQLGHSLGGP